MEHLRPFVRTFQPESRADMSLPAHGPDMLFVLEMRVMSCLLRAQYHQIVGIRIHASCRREAAVLHALTRQMEWDR